MIAHPGKAHELTVPERPEDHPWVGYIVQTIAVEEHGEDTGEDQEPETAGEEKRLRLIGIHLYHSIMSALIADQKVCDEECHKIHQGVPSYR